MARRFSEALGNSLVPFGRLSSVPAPEGLVARFLRHASCLVLPASAIAFIRAWGVAFMTRAIVILQLQEDYVMAARAHSLSERRVIHGLVSVPNLRGKRYCQ